MNSSPSNPICGPPRSRPFIIAVVLVAVAMLTPGLLAQWVVFEDQTTQRSDVPDPLFANDPNEKDYAFGDLDRDGDLDLVIVRKQPVTTSGKRENVLMMNQGGVLTDRTVDFAVDADIPGDMGFKTPTNDRDVAVVDVNQDGWLDVITTTAISMGGDPKHIGYPRIYMNQCCSVGGCEAETCSTENWLGLRFEDARMPLMLTDNGASGVNPCFCAVNHGDLTGDGYPDLYFTDYDSACGAGDFNDKLLINQGAANPGFFVDVTETNFILGATGFPVSAFGASGGIGKFNEDEHNDVLKQFAGFVGIAFNKPTDLGTFDKETSPIGGAVYFVNHGDLNNDGMLDLIVSDDGADRFLLNQGDGPDGMADFLSFTYSYSHSGAGGPAGDSGFGGQNLIADLNNDGHQDVLIADVDVDVGGCNRRLHIYKNLGGSDGGSRVIQEQTSGSNCQDLFGHPATCIVTTIPANMLKGTFDVAVFDINGDGWKDMVVGRCSGTELYMNVPPFGAAGSTPDGDIIEGAMLTVSRNGDQMDLHWGDSCSVLDTDYSVYSGAIGSDFSQHTPAVCSTGGLTTTTLAIGGGSSYYLVAPRNPSFTGSLGSNSLQFERAAGPAPCVPQVVGACDE